MHVHVRRERNQAKFRVEPVVLAWNRDFSPRELNEIRRIIVENHARIIEAWHEHRGTDGSDELRALSRMTCSAPPEAADLITYYDAQ